MGGCLCSAQENSDEYDEIGFTPETKIEKKDRRKISTSPTISANYAVNVHKRHNRPLPDVYMARGLCMERPHMTPSDKHYVIESWALIRPNMKTIFITAFTNMLATMEPARVTFFRNFKQVSEERDPEVQVVEFHVEKMSVECHAEKMSECIDYITDAMDKHRNKTDLEEYIHTLGEKHAAATVRIEYMDCIIPFFIDAMSPCLNLKEKHAYNIMDAWGLFLSRIIHIMKEAQAF